MTTLSSFKRQHVLECHLGSPELDGEAHVDILEEIEAARLKGHRCNPKKIEF
jgi:hypothetical protein